MPLSYNPASRAQEMPDEFTVKDSCLYCKWCKRFIYSLRSDNIQSHLHSNIHQTNRVKCGAVMSFKPGNNTKAKKNLGKRKNRRGKSKTNFTSKTPKSFNFHEIRKGQLSYKGTVKANPATSHVKSLNKKNFNVKQTKEKDSVYVLKKTKFTMIHPENFEGRDLVRCYSDLSGNYSDDYSTNEGEYNEMSDDSDNEANQDDDMKSDNSGENIKTIPEVKKKFGQGMFSYLSSPAKSKPKQQRKKNSFNLWASSKRKEITANNPGISFGEVSRRTGEIWKNMSANEKKIWKRKCKNHDRLEDI